MKNNKIVTLSFFIFCFSRPLLGASLGQSYQNLAEESAPPMLSEVIKPHALSRFGLAYLAALRAVSILMGPDQQRVVCLSHTAHSNTTRNPLKAGVILLEHNHIQGPRIWVSEWYFQLPKSSSCIATVTTVQQRLGIETRPIKARRNPNAAHLITTIDDVEVAPQSTERLKRIPLSTAEREKQRKTIQQCHRIALEGGMFGDPYGLTEAVQNLPILQTSIQPRPLLRLFSRFRCRTPSKRYSREKELETVSTFEMTIQAALCQLPEQNKLAAESHLIHLKQRLILLGKQLPDSNTESLKNSIFDAIFNFCLTASKKEKKTLRV